MYKIFAMLGAVIVGIAAGIQPSMNSGLGKITSPRTAALLNFLLGGTIVLIINIITGDIKNFSNIKDVPWYYLLGGALGCVIVLGTVLIVPIIGTSSMLSILVTLQLTMGVISDHFGLFGLPKTPVSLARIIGIVFMIIGARFVIMK